MSRIPPCSGSERNQRGSAIVEASLILMLLVTILLGCFDFGFVLFQHQTLIGQASSAARYGAIYPSDLTAIQNMVLYGSPSVPAGNSAGAPGIFGLTPSNVSVSRASSGTPEDRIAISVSGYNFTFIAPFIAGRFTGKPIQVSLSVEAP